jgi:hypothetical protein
LPPKAEIGILLKVRFAPNSEVGGRNREVRFTPESRLNSDIAACPFGATSGHSIIAVPLLIRSHLPRENVMNPSLFGIRTFGSVWALIVSFSPMMPLSCNK